MREEFIHFLWRYRLFNTTELKTTNGMPLQIIHTGSTNKDAGPDFSAAQVRIDDTLWAGNVEIHINSSDWFKHGHQHDDAYQNIILHVVFNHDKEITDQRGNQVPVLEIRNCYDPSLLKKYESIIGARSWIPCAGFIQHTDRLIIMNWLSRLLVERLENRSEETLKFLHYFGNSWEQTFYYFLARNFGFKVNASPFALLAQKTPLTILAKHRDDLTSIEALLFGQAGLLNKDFTDAYPALLQKEYEFFKHKYQLTPIDGALWKFGKLRPSNFPTLRIAQFARLIYQSSHLFSKTLEAQSFSDIKKLFVIKCSPYWKNHYQFDKPSSAKDKNLGESAVLNISINTIAPLKFVYGSESLQPAYKELAVGLLSELPPEENTIIRKWRELGIKPANAADSQALLELKKYYCTPKKCLSCAIGHNLIKNNMT